MNKIINKTFLECAALFGAAATACLGQSIPAPLPVAQLNQYQLAELPYFTEIPLANASFKTAAMVDVSAQPNLHQLDVHRNASVTSAAYAGVSLPFTPTVVPGPATTAAPPPGSYFDFKKSGDSAQGWATMTANGIPFLSTVSLGQATAAGTASWHARITVPAGDSSLYVQFSLPAAEVDGATEQNGPSPYQSRIVADLQLNGHPIWSSEADRITVLSDQLGSGSENCIGSTEKASFLTRYGVPLDMDPNNALKTSTPRTIVLNIGSLVGGETVDLSFVVRTDTKGVRQCCPHTAQNTPELFCTRSTANTAWDVTLQPVRFWVSQ